MNLLTKATVENTDIINNPPINNNQPTNPTIIAQSTLNIDAVNIEKRMVAPEEITYSKADAPKIVVEIYPEVLKKALQDNDNSVFEHADHIVVLGDLKIEAGSYDFCSQINSLYPKVEFPQNMTVKGDFVIKPGGRINVTLPKTLHVKKSFEMIEIYEVNELPKVLTVDDTFKCVNSPITELPENLAAKSIVLVSCDKVTAIPSSVKVTDSLTIQGCDSFTTLPEKIVLKTLTIEGSFNLTTLTEDLDIETLNLSYSSITDIPKIIKKELMILGSHEKINFPENFEVPNLTLAFCPQPINTKDITVTNKLSVISCDYIKYKENLPKIKGKIQKLNIEREFSRNKKYDEPGCDYTKEDHDWEFLPFEDKSIKQEYQSLEDLSNTPNYSDLATKYPYIENLNMRLNSEISCFTIETDNMGNQ